MSRFKTEQALANFVVSKIIAQGKASATTQYGRMICKYRADGGLKCAAGWLIDDHRYQPSLEGKNINCSEVANALRDSGIKDSQLRLVERLQVAHDTAARQTAGDADDFSPEFKTQLRACLKDFGLDVEAAIAMAGK